MMTTSGQAGALIAGRYRLERPTGGGTWPEEIWQGFDETLNRPVMMRLLPIEGDSEPDLDEQVQSVVAQVARLGHPNIAQVYDVGHEGSIRYVVSEWTGGRTLGQIMATGPQSWQRTADWGQQIAEALAALHAIGLVDGVLGPETVSVMDDRRVKLTDVGLGAQEGGSGRFGAADDQATQLFPGGGAFGGDPEATQLMGPGGSDDDATRMVRPFGDAEDATRVVAPYGPGADDPTRMVPASSYGEDADATRLVSGGSRGAVPAGAASDIYALGAILWTAMVGYPPEVGPGDTAGPDLGPLRSTGAPADMAMLLQSMLAASAGLRPNASVAANRFAALGFEARETRSDPLPTAVLGAGVGAGVGAAAAGATRAVGPLRVRDDDDDYVPPGGGSGSGKKAGIAIGVALLVVLAGVAIALVLSNKSKNNTLPTGTSSVTAPTTSPGQISLSAAPSTSAAATTTSAAPTTSSAAPTTTSAAPTTSSAAPTTSSAAATTPPASDTGTDPASSTASSSASTSETPTSNLGVALPGDAGNGGDNH
jgi:eukaryotic-like serine/threonine-protein kinase